MDGGFAERNEFRVMNCDIYATLDFVISLFTDVQLMSLTGFVQ